MKKLNALLIMSLLLILSSCSSDDDDNNGKVSNTTKDLVSITEDYYTNNTPTASSKFNFYYDKLINIQHSNGSYDDIYYERGLISRILEFDANNNLEWTITYAYNSFNQLIQKKVIPSPNNPITVSRQKDFVYNGNVIQSENSWSDGGFHANTITLNSDNFMIEDKLFNSDNDLVDQRLFEYVNNNLTKQTKNNADNNTTYEETYNYLNKTSSKEYRYSQYLFGSEWKNNSALNTQFGLGQQRATKISENYVSDYHAYHFVLNVSVTGTFSYEFDANDYILKQTETITRTSTADIYKTVTTYQYE
ncbi:hypothetical protein [Psychroserpens jangbogonensis]|uniref:hypothetical protein n=1 Tax=Psychroserpens jangbogonensis TaxID=1484460 RepID=UPI00053E31FA|nr:hypothetical protein [Psychroserpens jangbogonensis]